MKGFRSHHHPPSLDFSWRNIRKPRVPRGADVRNVGRHIQQQLQTGRNSETPSRVGAIDKPAAVPGADIHPVLALKTAHGHDQAGVRDIRPVRRDFSFRGWTGVRLCVDRAEDRVRPKQEYLESSFLHSLFIREGGGHSLQENRTTYMGENSAQSAENTACMAEPTLCRPQR